MENLLFMRVTKGYPLHHAELVRRGKKERCNKMIRCFFFYIEEQLNLAGETNESRLESLF